MGIIPTILIVLSILCLIVGLLLSGSGSTAGLNSIVGQDLELFKKTKDRGFIKILQMFLFSMMLVMIVLAILYSTLPALRT
jgi:preprotein translocase subunit SecG